MGTRFDSYWIRFSSEQKPDYEIKGKYLFFDENVDKLIEIANNEIEKHGFHQAKVNRHLLERQTDHVLCLYYKDDTRKDELAERNRQEYGVKYRYWKSDEATSNGQYSKEFLEKLSASKRKHFTQKEVVNNIIDEELTEEELTEEGLTQFEKNLIIEYCRENRLKREDIIIKEMEDMTREDYSHSDMEINGKFIVRKKR